MHKDQLMIANKEEINNQIHTSKDELIKKLRKSLERKDEKLKELKLETRNLLFELDEGYKELRKTQEELIIKEKLSAAGGLAAGLAHEMRNSLNIIGISVQYLHNKFNPGDERREFTETIMNKIERLNSLATDLLRFSKPHNPNFKKCNIHKLIDRVLSLIKFKCLVQKISLVKKYANDLPPVEIDNELIEQAILNLIDNALWAMHERGKLTITIGKTGENNSIEIKIADTGCGISKKDVSHIFEPFFTRRKNSTGLGLSIVHRTMEIHKGFIDVESKPKRGATFTMRLPISQKGASLNI